MMRLYSQRAADNERAAREAAGESFWTTEFSPTLRQKMLHYMRLIQRNTNYFGEARNILLYSYGLERISGPYNSTDDFEVFFKTCSNEQFPDVLEATLWAIKEKSWGNTVEQFKDVMNGLMEQERVSFELMEDHIVPFESKQMHESVVKPVLLVLHNEDKYAQVNEAFRNALAEITSGNPQDALTDLGTALQEALKACGYEGATIGEQLKAAKKAGVLGGANSPLAEAMEKTTAWTASVRNQRSDAHAVDPTVNKEEAWLMVHVAGALILYLTGRTTG